MRKMKYAKNYNNKLNSEIFTTIRKYRPEKFKILQDSIGATFTNLLKDKPFSEAILIKVKKELTDDIDDELIMVDTGIENPGHARKLLANFGCGLAQMAIILTFKRVANG